MIIGARSAGGARTAHSVSRTRDVLTGRATDHGNAIVDPAGVVCSVTKVTKTRLRKKTFGH